MIYFFHGNDHFVKMAGMVTSLQMVSCYLFTVSFLEVSDIDAVQENSFESSNLFEKSIDAKGDEKESSKPIHIDIDASSIQSTPPSIFP